MLKPNDHPILFSSPMIRAIIEGRKTQTRRILRYQPPNSEYTLGTLIDTTSSKHHKHCGKFHWLKVDGLNVLDSDENYFKCPYGFIGDHLWVRETWCQEYDLITSRPIEGKALYAATEEREVLLAAGDGFASANKDGSMSSPWKPSIHMPRWASRILLEVTGVAVQRLQEITEDDFVQEGMFKFPFEDSFAYSCDPNDKTGHASHTGAFAAGWDQINGERGPWRENPMVWVISFKVIDQRR